MWPFTRKPRYLIDEHGELRRIYQREGGLGLDLKSKLHVGGGMPDTTAVKINGKWVLVEVQSNEQRKTIEIQTTATRRQSILFGILTILAYLLLFYKLNRDGWDKWLGYELAWLAYDWQIPWLGTQAGQKFLTFLLHWSAYWLVIDAASKAFGLLSPLLGELLYLLRYPFMRGARTVELPRINAAPPPKAPASVAWDADYEDPAEAARRMGGRR
jgi:hypothetical protein